MTGNESPTLSSQRRYCTRVLPIDVDNVGHIIFCNKDESFLSDWSLELSESPDATNLRTAAEELRSGDTPVAFPTETVYGLGADATRSTAVRGIYRAKQRPSDNPLIVHISSLKQLKNLFQQGPPVTTSEESREPIPMIYWPLISRFWPGPLTILMSLPSPSPFAPEVTNNLTTVGVRMPSSLHALALIKLAGIPLAAPSANTSSKPSPTSATHVLHDLDGRIKFIVDGGPSNIGVESTVVDGLSSPPLILRPGGISIDMLKTCAGWSSVQVAYSSQEEVDLPRAPGMKYKHYSPQAKVILVKGRICTELIKKSASHGSSFGILASKTWNLDDLGLGASILNGDQTGESMYDNAKSSKHTWQAAQSDDVSNAPPDLCKVRSCFFHGMKIQIWTMSLGTDTVTMARSLFDALREMDRKGVSTIYVEAIDEQEGHLAAAVMNRLRKAAETQIDNL